MTQTYQQNQDGLVTYTALEFAQLEAEAARKAAGLSDAPFGSAAWAQSMLSAVAQKYAPKQPWET